MERPSKTKTEEKKETLLKSKEGMKKKYKTFKIDVEPLYQSIVLGLAKTFITKEDLIARTELLRMSKVADLLRQAEKKGFDIGKELGKYIDVKKVWGELEEKVVIPERKAKDTKKEDKVVNERKDLTKYMINEDKPKGKEWCAGEQLEALRFYLNKKVKILGECMVGDYQGDCYAILNFEGTIVLWRDGYGSCSGCDALEDENGYEYIKTALQEGNTRQFKSLKKAEKYIEDTEDFWWNKFSKKLFTQIKKVKNKK